VAACHVLDALRGALKAVVHAHRLTQLGQVPAARPVATAVMAPAQGTVLLDDVKVACSSSSSSSSSGTMSREGPAGRVAVFLAHGAAG
jgi:hypothetical protein